MNALVSGSAAKALIIDGGSFKSFDVNDPSVLLERGLRDLPYFFGEAADLRVVENSDVESTKSTLRFECDVNEALDLALISLDAELPDEIRKEAIEGLDEPLSDGRVVERLESILYARPLPDDADLAGALDLCERAGLRTSLLLQTLENRQTLISQAYEAWNAIPTKIFGGHEQRDAFQHVAVTEGLNRALIIGNETQTAASSFLLMAGLNDSVKQLPNYRQVLQHWTNPFLQKGKAREVRREVYERPNPEKSRRRKRGRVIGIDRPGVLREVNQKKAIIVGAMHRRDFNLVSDLVDDLVAFQLRNGENEYAARSLCDLAIEAKSLGIYPLQLELTDRSITVAPDDGWSWAQHADALLNANQFDNAFNAYQQAVNFGAGVIALTGRAEVLKAQGRLPAALAAFEDVIREHPEDVVAKNGRAEVLKAQGQLPAALAAYDDVIREHPEDIVAKTGRAEVLKAQGQLPAALAAFNDVIREHPESAIAKTGRAEVLKAQGQLSAALAAFNDVIGEHPELVFAKNGRAEVLKAQGQLPDALAAYDDVIREHPEDVVAKTGRAEVLKAQGQLPAALAAFNDVIAEHPQDVVAKTGRAEVLKAQGQLSAALAAFNDVIGEHPEHVFAKNGRAEVLKAQGQLPDALAAYDDVIREHPESAVAKTGRAEVLKAQGQLPAALAAYDDVIREHPEDVVAKNGRAEVLKAQGQLPDALAAYDDVIREHPESAVAKTGRAEVLKAQGQLPDALAAYDDVIREHPESAVAKTGRAEVLKAQGQLSAALAAFNDVIGEHPEHVFAKNGRSSVLAAMSRYDEALLTLPDRKPVTLDDWIGYHIRGMILLRIGKSQEAIQIFSEGVQKNPSPSSREYFRSALAVAWLRSRDFKKASQSLEEVKSPLLQPMANVLRIHAFGAQREQRRAESAYESLMHIPHLLENELTQELRHQFILSNPARHDEQWVTDREVNMILLAA